MLAKLKRPHEVFLDKVDDILTLNFADLAGKQMQHTDSFFYKGFFCDLLPCYFDLHYIKFITSNFCRRPGTACVDRRKRRRVLQFVPCAIGSDRSKQQFACRGSLALL